MCLKLIQVRRLILIKMDTFHELINAVDEIKEDITDQKYKHLVETIAELKKKEKRYVRVKYVDTHIKYDEDDEPVLHSEIVHRIIMITETEENKAGFNHLDRKSYENWVKYKLLKMNCAEHYTLIEYEEL